jgi:hypothetical protein
MKLYYTTSSAPEVAQPKTILSLGGFKSSTPVRNSEFGNLFGDVSLITPSNFQQNKYIGLVLKNETGSRVTYVALWFEYPTGCVTKLKVAAVDMAANANGDMYMEQIPNQSSKPISGEFYEATSDSKADLGSMEIGEQIGLWIERELLVNILSQQSQDVYEQDPANVNRFREKAIVQFDEIKLNISWT